MISDCSHCPSFRLKEPLFKTFSSNNMSPLCFGVFFVVSLDRWCLTSAPFRNTSLLLSAVHLQSSPTPHRLPAASQHSLLLPNTHSHVLTHYASATPHPPSTFPLLQSHLYSPCPIPFFLPPPSLLFLPSWFALSGSLWAAKKSFTLHWALWSRLHSPLFSVLE